MKKKWIRIFSLSERSFLEESLNKFIQEYDNVEIHVWCDQTWNAYVRYEYSESPTYTEIKE